MEHEFTIHTSKIPILDAEGNQISEVNLPEKITPCLSRRGGFSKSGIYYKGAGTIYYGHMTNEPKSSEQIIKATNVIYQKYNVANPKLIKKFGIFTFPHQPPFSDYEGACGPKEQKLPQHVKEFRLSAISEIVDVIDTGLPNHNIYAYKLKELLSNPKDVIHLFEYILKEDYNSAWDKNLWADITGYCYVRDLADWFESNQFNHKLGTVYGLLKSIYTSDKYLYSLITNELIGANHYGQQYIIYISALIVRHFCPDLMPELDLENLTSELYRTLLTQLYSGKSCCHLENDEPWAWVRIHLNSKIDYQVAMFEKEMNLDKIRYLELYNFTNKPALNPQI